VGGTADKLETPLSLPSHRSQKSVPALEWVVAMGMMAGNTPS
jgi:hypothetical protein